MGTLSLCSNEIGMQEIKLETINFELISRYAQIYELQHVLNDDHADTGDASIVSQYTAFFYLEENFDPANITILDGVEVTSLTN